MLALYRHAGYRVQLQKARLARACCPSFARACRSTTIPPHSGHGAARRFAPTVSVKRQSRSLHA